MRWLLLILALAACGRPLTEGERVFMAELQPRLETGRIRMVEMPLVGLRLHTRPARPRTTCRELIFPAPTTPTVQTSTAGVVFFHRVLVAPDYYLDNYLSGYPDRMHLVAAMYFAHEMTHIWQWQNRHVTGYHPLRGAAEHYISDDPYLFDTSEERSYLEYGYEQQSSLVEEYVCCRALDPTGPRTTRLEQILSPHMALTPINERMDNQTCSFIAS